MTNGDDVNTFFFPADWKLLGNEKFNLLCYFVLAHFPNYSSTKLNFCDVTKGLHDLKDTSPKQIDFTVCSNRKHSDVILNVPVQYLVHG